jgi:hypothetical protein
MSLKTAQVTQEIHQNVDAGLQAPSILLMGAPGSGKTASISTLLESGLKVRVISTEANAIDTLLDFCAERKIDTSQLQWKHIEPTPAGFTALNEMAKNISMMNYQALTEMKGGFGKNVTKQFMEVLKTLEHFISDRDGQDYGNVGDWKSDTVLVIDSLSGVNEMCKALAAGYKPALHQGEWGVMMNLEEQFLLKMTSLDCFFVMTAHLEREKDEITGGTRIMVGALGRKLAPKIPRSFSEVVLAEKSGDKFTWSTANPQADLKFRALANSSNLQPTFKPIIEAYRKRLETAGKKT